MPEPPSWVEQAEGVGLPCQMRQMRQTNHTLLTAQAASVSHVQQHRQRALLHI